MIRVEDLDRYLRDIVKQLMFKLSESLSLFVCYTLMHSLTLIFWETSVAAF